MGAKDVRWVREYSAEITGLIILAGFLIFITSGLEFLTLKPPEMSDFTVSGDLKNLSTLFLSIFIEGIPFILAGGLISSLIHVYVKQETIWRLVPKTPLIAIPTALLIGLILPVCECGIVPVARRLIRKGLPPYVAFTFLLAAPVINPVTIASTYFAFGDNWNMVLFRLFTAAIVAGVMGWLFFLFFKGDVLKADISDHQHGQNCCKVATPSGGDRLGHAMYHSIFEFMDMGKYFIAGALVAASFQTFVGMAAIRELGENEWLSVPAMMGLAFGLSLCSSADAFVAASFRTALTSAPLLVFLVYGPMMDLKNLFMLAGSFRLPVVLFFFAGTTLLCLLTVFLFFM